MKLIDASAWADRPALDAARARARSTVGITLEVRCACAGAAPGSDFEVTALNRRRRAPSRAHPEAFSWCAAVDARQPDHARDQVGRASMRGAVGIDLFTEGADELAIDAVVMEASRRGLPVRVADAAVLVGLLRVHPRATFVLSRPGAVPHRAAELAPFAAVTNVMYDLAGCGAERGALDAALRTFGPERLLWGTGDRMEIALAQLRALEVIAPGEDALDAIRWRNAERLHRRLGTTG